MGIFDGIKNQLRSVIQWENPGENDLFYRWSDRGDEIKDASKLIVGPGQGCIFVYRGKVEAVHTTEGTVDLSTENIPFWTTISKFMQAFESEAKTGIYFFRKTKILNQKWGTASVIKYQDPKYNFPVGLRANGNYSFTIKDPQGFFVNVIGGAPLFTVEDFRKVMVSRIVQPLTDYFAEAKLAYEEIDAKRDELSAGLAQKIAHEFENLGFEINDFRIEGTSFDEETMKRINRIGDVTAEAAAAQAAGLNYAQLQQIEALRDAAKNEGGAAGAGVGIGAGIGLGNMMAGAMNPGGVKQESADPMVKLQKLKQMLDGGLITQEEFEAKKKEILSGM
jgi:membrane protease subunit (stomatin/prohibitin family)